ncbi:hypothetical protein SK128_003707 [Halocaridina rubra]|uniref:Organic cation transporter protein n=1 Tax=Halocaridina rubra TaxID=373956 RepID=A0AAN8WDL4_HALRR
MNELFSAGTNADLRATTRVSGNVLARPDVHVYACSGLERLFRGLLPESPRWLIAEGRHEEAIKVLKDAAKSNHRNLPPTGAIIISMKAMVKPREIQSKQEIPRFIASKLRHFLILVIKSDMRVKALICYFCWFSVSMVYYGISLNSENLSTDPYLYVFLGGLIEVPAYIMLWPMLAYLGRKVSLISLYIVCAITICVIALLLATMDEVSTGIIIFLSLSGKLAITAAFHLIYVFTAELFPTKYRSLAVGESSMMARVGSISSPYINDLLGDAISWGPSALFALVSVLAAFLSMILPETKGTDMTEEVEFEMTDDNEKDGKHINHAQDNEAFSPT